MTLQVPEALEKEHDETVRLIAAKLYESGKLSLGQAAEMCSMEKWDFAEILINYGVHYFDASAATDLEAKAFSSKKKLSAHDFVGILSKEDAILMEQAITEGCEKIHPDDWK
jgi:predicted HTH domain antitoxin